MKTLALLPLAALLFSACASTQTELAARTLVQVMEKLYPPPFDELFATVDEVTDQLGWNVYARDRTAVYGTESRIYASIPIAPDIPPHQVVLIITPQHDGLIHVALWHNDQEHYYNPEPNYVKRFFSLLDRKTKQTPAI